jgi:hypothetical protein
MDKKLILNTLQKHYNFEKDAEFAEFLGISGQLLSKWKSRNTFDVDVLYTKCTGVSPDYLLSGKEPIFSEPNANYTREEKKLIPLYDGVVTAGMQETAVLAPTHEPVEMIDAGDWFRDATAAMRVHGDSMSPEYKSGSIVALKEVINKRLVVYGEDYLIETSEYRVIKRLQKSSEKQSWFACSLNQDIWEGGELKGRLIHEPFDIHLDDVIRIYQVVGSVKRNHSSRIVKV